MGWPLIRFSSQRIYPGEKCWSKRATPFLSEAAPGPTVDRGEPWAEPGWQWGDDVTECVLSLCLPLSAPDGPVQNSCFALSPLFFNGFIRNLNSMFITKISHIKLPTRLRACAAHALGLSLVPYWTGDEPPGSYWDKWPDIVVWWSLNPRLFSSLPRTFFFFFFWKVIL